jgi:exopolysaccharide biosynthesis polyprenyl glycosylphosphotransferase
MAAIRRNFGEPGLQWRTVVQPATSQERAPVSSAAQPRRFFRLRGPENDATRRRLLFTADVLCLLLAVGAATLVEGTSDPLWALLAAPAWLLLAKAEGLYDADHPKIWHRTTDEAAPIFHWATLAVAGTLFMIRALPDVTVTFETAGAMWLTALASAFLLRFAARWIWRRIVPPERALVLGSGRLASAVTRKLALEPGHHLSLIEVASQDGPRSRQFSSIDLADLSREDLEYLIGEAGVERVILAVPELDEQTLARVVSACREVGIKLSVVPPMRAMLGTAVRLSHIAEMPVIEYGTWNPSASTMVMKRVVDIVVSAILLVLLAPLLLVIAALIRLDSRGAALFRQVRAGRDGRPFKILKFRTMCQDAEERISEVISVEELTEPMYKLRHDPRVTRLGRFLRRTSLDELPQLFNVLKGDMSLVGPRPEEAWLVDRYGETERFRLAMRPGVTGPMQVHGRGELTFQERLAVEREYVENYSFDKDLRILMRTVSAISRAHGAY